MKLVVFLYTMDCGGAERVTANLCNHWASLGRNVTIVTLVKPDKDFYELDPAIQRISLNLADESGNPAIGMWNNFRRVRAFRQILKDLQPDFAISMMTTSSILLALASIDLPVKTVGCEHNHPPQRPAGFIWENLRRCSYGLLSAVTALTNESRVWLEQNTNAKKVLTLPNPVIWPLKPAEPRIIPGSIYPSGKKRLLSVGRFCEEKAFNRLIDAFSYTRINYPDWSLAIVGEGSLRPRLEKQIQELQLQDCVFLPGRAGNVNEWYEAADLYAMSSQSEGFPMTLVEAMSHGLAAVSFDCDTGPRDIISHEVNGLLVKPEDSQELAKALARLMNDDALRSRYSKKASAVREIFSMDKISAKWEKLFTNTEYS